jgi:hypothetical protein
MKLESQSGKPAVIIRTASSSSCRSTLADDSFVVAVGSAPLSDRVGIVGDVADSSAMPYSPAAATVSCSSGRVRSSMTIWEHAWSTNMPVDMVLIGSLTSRPGKHNSSNEIKCFAPGG